MATYLLTWNPAKWKWGDLAAEARVLKRKGKLAGYWSCGNQTHIRNGDRVFLVKQGDKPRGIVASGWATSDKPYDGPHWNPERAKRGDTARYVDLEFEVILNPDTERVLDVRDLKDGALGRVKWGTQDGGIRIPDDAAAILEERWRDHRARPQNDGPGHAAIARDGGRRDVPSGAAVVEESQLLRRITVNPAIFGGKPIIRGRRLAVEHVLAMLAAGDSAREIVADHPWLEPADVQACLVYARRVVGQERIEPLRIDSGR